MRILLDMDGVLVNFVKGVCDLWEVSEEKLRTHWEIGTWDLVAPLGKTIDTPLTKSDFWIALENRPQFWAGLEEMSWLDSLLNLAGEDFHIVSAPGGCASSYRGKIQWLKRRFGNRFDRFAITPYKHLFARPDALLIDDKDENVETFVRAGGHGIIFPTYHNSKHAHRDTPLAYVSEQLDRIRASYRGSVGALATAVMLCQVEGR